MNAIAVLPDRIPITRPPSAALAEAMGAAMRAYEAGRSPLTADAAQALAPEATARLRQVEAALDARATRDEIGAWVMMVVIAIGHPRDPDTIEAKRAILGDMLSDLPRRCFTKASAAKAAVEAGNFFPSIERLRASIAGEADDLLRERGALRAVLRIAAPPAPKAAKTPADVDHAQQVARTVMAETTARLASLGASYAKAAEGVEQQLARIAEMAAEGAVHVERSLRIGLSAARNRMLTPAERLELAEQIATKGGPGAGAARMRADALRRQMGEGA